MCTTQSHGVMDFILKKKQTNPEFLASDMRVIRFTLIFITLLLSRSPVT